jgi:multiple sugar transport system permease protein
MLDRTRTLPALLLILPSLALAFWIIGYPIYDVAHTSVHAVSRFGKVQGFAGFANFAKLFGDPIFIGSLWRTIVWTVSVVGGTIILSIPIAVILNDDFHGRGLARLIVMLPWAISLAMTAIVWRWSLNGQYGMINATLFQVGLLDRPVEWLASFDTAFPIEIAIGILVSIPFTATVLLGGLSSIPSDIYEAATIDGATGWQRFRYMTLPLMKPFLQIAIVLNVINVFNSFPIIWVLTQGDPANSTDILVTYLYKLAFRYGRLDVASAMSLIMFGILLVFTATYLVLAMRSEEKGA